MGKTITLDRLSRSGIVLSTAMANNIVDSNHTFESSNLISGWFLVLMFYPLLTRSGSLDLELEILRALNTYYVLDILLSLSYVLFHSVLVTILVTTDEATKAQ